MILKNKNDFKEQGKLAEENAEMSSPIQTSQTTFTWSTIFFQIFYVIFTWNVLKRFVILILIELSKHQ